jgi:hypothetical protein
VQKANCSAFSGDADAAHPLGEHSRARTICSMRFGEQYLYILDTIRCRRWWRIQGATASRRPTSLCCSGCIQPVLPVQPPALSGVFPICGSAAQANQWPRSPPRCGAQRPG